jgi:hypothetical protein
MLSFGRSTLLTGVLGLIVAVFIACSSTQAAGPSTSSPSASPTVTTSPTPSPPASVSEADLAAAKAMWEKSAITNYTYRLEILCFCFFEHGLPITVTVVNGATTSMTWADGTAVTNPDLSFPIFTDASTIDRMFARLQQSRQTSYVTQAVFDGTLGYPTSVSINPVANIADEEVGYKVSGLKEFDPEFPKTGGHP